MNVRIEIEIMLKSDNWRTSKFIINDTILKINKPCNKSYVIHGLSSNIYGSYEFIFERPYIDRHYPIYGFDDDYNYKIHDSHILNKFIVDVFNPTNEIFTFLKGAYGETTMKVEFESSERHIYWRQWKKNNIRASSTKVAAYHTCLFLQHDDLRMSIPIQQLSEKDFEMLYNTTNIRFIYTVHKDGIPTSVTLVYNSWVHPCREIGFLKFDLIVREKIDRSHLEIVFFGEHRLALGRNKYYYSATKNKFLIIENSIININASAITLKEAIQNPRSTHIYLDNFDAKTIKCIYNRGIAINQKVSQFGIVRYYTYLLPSMETFIDGIIAWHPSKEDKFLESIANESLRCKYE